MDLDFDTYHDNWVDVGRKIIKKCEICYGGNIEVYWDYVKDTKPLSVYYKCHEECCSETIDIIEIIQY